MLAYVSPLQELIMENVVINYVESRSNLYRVPLKQWRRWTPTAKQAFNEVYSAMVKNQGLFLHPKQERLSRSHWQTTAWNAAWTAANAIH